MKRKNQFITISKSDQGFQQYLTGSFSHNKRAVPVHSFSVNTPEEKVTFELKDSTSFNFFNVLLSLLSLSRPVYWVFTLGPLFTVLGLNQALNLPIHGLNTLLCFLILILLNMAAFCLNDYYDHLAGVDRISLSSGSQVIQKGWFAAYQVKYLAFMSIAIATVLSVPILMDQPLVAISVIAFVAFSLFAFSYKNLGLKYKGIGELIVFMALGPLIVTALSLVISGEVTSQHIAVGVLLGWFAMFHMQVKNWRHIMPDAQAGIKTFISRIGFDKAKLYLCFQLSVLFLLSCVVFYLPMSHVFRLIVTGGTLLGCLYIGLKVLKIHSPMSSKLKSVYFKTLIFNWLFCLIFAGALLFDY